MNRLLKTALNSLAFRLISTAVKTPYFHLKHSDGRHYMDRFWVVPYDDANQGEGTGPVSFFKRPFAWLLQKLDVAARVHHIISSDDDRAHHDHPWPYVTVVLGGGYWEKKPVYDSEGVYLGDSRIWYGPGSIMFRSAESWHRLEVPEGQTAWTLFITGKYVQKWGFLIDAAARIKVSYNVFLGIPDKKE